MQERQGCSPCPLRKDRFILMNFVTHCYFAMGLFYRRERNISLWHCMALVDRMKIPNIVWLERA